MTEALFEYLRIIMRLLRTTINKNNFHLRATQL